MKIALVLALFFQVSDSVLSWQTFMNLVLNNHPVAVQAALDVDIARGDSMAARGVLDPKLSYELDEKTFKDTDYYEYSIPSLTIPTITGIDVKLGTERTQGAFINPDRTTPEDGLISAGLVVPIGRGILQNERLTTIRKARQMVSMSRADRDKAILSLFQESGYAFVELFVSQQKLVYAQNSLELADLRLKLVREQFFQGDKAPFDTLEARVEVAKRQIYLQQAELDFQAARININSFLWMNGNVPMEIGDSTSVFVDLEQLYSFLPSEEELFQSIETHPILNAQRAKLNIAELERRFYQMQRMPELNVSFFPLWDQADSDIRLDDVQANQKTSVSLEFPLFLRKERGMYRKARSKEERENLELVRLNRDLRLMVQQYFYQLGQIDLQIRSQLKLIDHSENLLRLEQIRFEAGESNLFIVNTRERRLLENQLTLVDLEKMFLGNWIYLQYVTGIPLNSDAATVLDARQEE